MTTADSTIFNPTDLVLELDQSTLDRAWSLSQSSSTNRWQNYLNRLALAVFLPWLQAEEDTTAKVDNRVQTDRWELVNGTAISMQAKPEVASKGLGDTKLVLIPIEAEDTDELRVPQEWIDLPSWTADYYLAVQVNVDAGFVRIWGYTTHRNLKQGSFNYGDRTYSLTEEQLICDLNALWVARELCPDEVTQAAVEPIAELIADSDRLIERLGNPEQLLPRLAVPFATWGALLENPQLCQRLAAARRGTPAKTPILKWFEQGLSELANELGWQRLEISLEGARGTGVTPSFGLAKKMTIADRPYQLKVLPLPEPGAWRFELSCLINTGCMIPTGFKLRLLTAELTDFEGNEDIANEPVSQLAIELDLDPGESIVWQVEPTPDNYQQEVLQF